MARRQACGWVAVLAATIAGITAVPAAANQTAKVPAKLLGAWGRTITAADWKRAGRPNEAPGHFSMYIGADGSVALAEFTARLSASGNRVTFGGVPGCGKTKGLYRWTVVNRRLTLTSLRDACRLEVGLLAGVWTKG